MLKKPLVAAILCVLIVVSSTVISTHARLDPWCEDIADGFTAAGGIAEQLDAVCAAASGIMRVAEAYGIDCFETQDLCESLRSSTYVNSPHNLFMMYQMLSGEITDLTNSLKLKELSAQDDATLSVLNDELSVARNAINENMYNSSVSFFLRQELGGFSRDFADLCGVNLPEQFA